jgi:hypothetical protein
LSKKEFNYDFLTDACDDEMERGVEHFVCHWRDTFVIGSDIIYQHEKDQSCTHHFGLPDAPQMLRDESFKDFDYDLSAVPSVFRWPCSWITQDDVVDSNKEIIEYGRTHRLFFKNKQSLQQLMEVFQELEMSKKRASKEQKTSEKSAKKVKQ